MKNLRRTLCCAASVVAALFSFAACSKINEPEQKNVIAIVYDISSIYDGKTAVSEARLIELLGEPDSIDEWKYSTSASKNYPIKTLYYGYYEYSFNNDCLQRISINSSIQYESKADFLAMFGLKKYSNSIEKDTGSAYRVSMCGVNDFWMGYDSKTKEIKWVKISLGNLFLE